MADDRPRLDQAQIAKLRELANAGKIGSQIRGRWVVFTGKMSMRRTDMEALAKAAGAHTDTRVGFGPRSIVVTGDTGIHGETRKIREARQRGASILTEQEFVELFNQ